MKTEDQMTVSELFLKSAKQYQINAVLFWVAGMINIAFLVFSLLTAEGTVFSWIIRALFLVGAIITNYCAIQMMDKKIECINKARKWENL